MPKRKKIHLETRQNKFDTASCGKANPLTTCSPAKVTCKDCLKKMRLYRLGRCPELEQYRVNAWIDPNDLFVPDTTPSGRSRGVRLLDSWISSYLDMVKETEPPQRFHLWTAITILGAMLGRKCTIKLGPELFFPNLYTVLIGPPGVRKGTAIKYGVDLVADLQSSGTTMAPDAVTKEQLCKELEDAQQAENIGSEILVHSSLFVVAPELVVFIKENDHERLGYLCQLYDGLSKFEYKTKTSGNNFIVNPGLWILGATTPNWIEIAMKQLGVGGGMTSRTVFVYAAKKGDHIPVTRLRPFDQSLRAALINDLSEIKQMAGSFIATPEADKSYSEWYEGRYLETGVDDDRFASYWERLPSMVIKVAMIISASKREDMVINADDMINAIRMFEHIHPEMPQSFGGLGYNVIGNQTEMIRNLLREKREASKSYIMRTLRMHISEWDYQRCKNSLVAERFCTRAFSADAGEEVLICLEKPLPGEVVGPGGRLSAVRVEYVPFAEAEVDGEAKE